MGVVPAAEGFVHTGMFIGYVINVNIFAQINANISSGAPAEGGQAQAQGAGGDLFSDILTLLTSPSGPPVETLIKDAPKGADSLVLIDAAPQATVAETVAADEAPALAPAVPQAETVPDTGAEATAAPRVQAAAPELKVTAATDMEAASQPVTTQGVRQEGGAGPVIGTEVTATAETSLSVARGDAPLAQAAGPAALTAMASPAGAEARRQLSTAGQTSPVGGEPRGAVPAQDTARQAGSIPMQAPGADTDAAAKNSKADAFGDSVSRLNQAAPKDGASEGRTQPLVDEAAIKVSKAGKGRKPLWQPAQKATGPAQGVQTQNEALVAESTFKAALKQGMQVQEAGGNSVHARRAAVAAEELPAPVSSEPSSVPRAGAEVAPEVQAGGRPQAAPAAQRAATGPRVINLDGHVFTIKNTSDTTIEVTLKPNGLGKLEIEVSLERGIVSAQINATDPVGKEIIQRNMQNILQMLERDGLNVGDFSVALRQGGQGDGSNGHEDNAASKDDASSERSVRAAPSGPRHPSEDGRLSIYV